MMRYDIKPKRLTCAIHPQKNFLVRSSSSTPFLYSHGYLRGRRGSAHPATQPPEHAHRTAYVKQHLYDMRDEMRNAMHVGSHSGENYVEKLKNK